MIISDINKITSTTTTTNNNDCSSSNIIGVIVVISVVVVAVVKPSYIKNRENNRKLFSDVAHKGTLTFP